MAGSLGKRDRSVPDHQVAVHQAGELARGLPLDGSAKGDRRLAALPVQLEAARPLRRVVAEPDGVDAIGRAVERGSTESDAAGDELIATTGDHPVRGGIGCQSVERLPAADAEAT